MASNLIVKYQGWRHSGAIWHGVNPRVKRALTKLIEVELTDEAIEQSLETGVRSLVKAQLAPFFDQRFNQPTMLLSSGLWDDGADALIRVLNRLNANGFLTVSGRELRVEISQLFKQAYLNGRANHVSRRP